jgi:hypothetical protein
MVKRPCLYNENEVRGSGLPVKEGIVSVKGSEPQNISFYNVFCYLTASRYNSIITQVSTNENEIA